MNAFWFYAINLCNHVVPDLALPTINVGYFTTYSSHFGKIKLSSQSPIWFVIIINGMKNNKNIKIVILFNDNLNPFLSSEKLSFISYINEYKNNI